MSNVKKVSDDHARGTYIHPEDGKKYSYPSSIESAHHVGHDGEVVYSPAQLESRAQALKMAKYGEEYDARQKANEAPLSMLSYEPIREEWRVEDLAEADENLSIAEEDADTEPAAEDAGTESVIAEDK